MLKLGVTLSLVFAVIASPQRGAVPRLNGRIVGGHDADIRDYPYTVSLEYTGAHRCGGTIIAPKWIVTAAHCVDRSIAISLLTIRAGSAVRGTGGQVHPVERAVIHPSYSTISLDYDIALLELSEDIILTDASTVIGMPQQGSDVVAGSASFVTGWGTLWESGNSSMTLQVVEVPIVEREQCNEIYQQIARTVSERMLCAGLLGVGGRDACHGDSGGPLTVNGLLFGVVSWGLGCGRADFPGVYAHVGALREWIFENSGI